jgi:ArsR family transcriptional regulator, arsenate/arsenite/antimonite-responsive transcriptional repressor
MLAPTSNFDLTRNIGGAMNGTQAVNALSALGHETRLALFRLLVERGPEGLPAGVIAERLALPPSSLTFHLQHLHRAGLRTQRRLVRQLIYAADFTAMNALLLYLTDNCCGRGPTAANCAPLCPTAAAPLTTGDDDGKQ